MDQATSNTAVSSNEPLWDVVEEHLSEAEFCQVEFERTLDHPLLTLAQLSGAMEARLIAHLDGLVIGGDAVAERLLLPQFDEVSDPLDASRATVATMALLQGPRARSVDAGLFHERAFVRAACVRGCELTPSPRLEAWAVDRFRETPDATRRAALMSLAGAQLDPPALLDCLQSDDPRLCAATARVVARGGPGRLGPVMESIIKHAEAPARDAALVGALAWGLPNAWRALEALAVDDATDAPLITRLYAVLGGPAAHARVWKLTENPRRRQTALSAIGYAGNSRYVQDLLDVCSGDDLLEAKLAAHAIALITGLDLNDAAYVVPDVQSTSSVQPTAADAEGLPPLEDDDLGADLVPAPEAALPVPNAKAIATFWKSAGAAFEKDQRYLWGKPLTPEAALEFLEHGVLRARHVIALMFGIRTGGRGPQGGSTWLDTRQLCARQRTRLAAIRALDVRSFARFYDR